MLTREEYKKISETRLALEQQSRDLKSRLRGIAHGPGSFADQRALFVLKPQLTACYMLIAESRGRSHLSEHTDEQVRGRAATAVDNLIHCIR